MDEKKVEEALGVDVAALDNPEAMKEFEEHLNGKPLSAKERVERFFQPPNRRPH